MIKIIAVDIGTGTITAAYDDPITMAFEDPFQLHFDFGAVATKPIRAVRDYTEFPHVCPRCGSRAYIGFNMVDHFEEHLNKSCK